LTFRGIDGKISAIKNRKTTCGGFSPYGYRISEDSRLVINEDEEFYQVDKTFAERMYNRNQGIMHPTMIKDPQRTRDGRRVLTIRIQHRQQ